MIRRLLPVVLMVASVSAAGQSNPLPPEKAFSFAARALGPQKVEATFDIADGYYLYREKMHFLVEPSTSRLEVPALPPGKVKDDAFFGKVETYRGRVVVNLDLNATTPGQKIVVQAESQGCADIGLCYPPTTQRVTLVLPAATGRPSSNDPVKKSWFN